MPLKYIRYSRKSSEAKEKQALSITDQNAECDEIIVRKDLHVVNRFQESKTAFKPQKRPMFAKMIALIKEGKANAILTWKPDRLCRNPEEGGILLQLLQDGILKAIRTPQDVYTPDSDHLILQIHFGMANQYSRVLSQNVRRGLNRKVHDRKEYPRPAPIGFEGFGERGQRSIKPHSFEGPLIEKAFKLAATGVYSLDDITEQLHKDGLRTKFGKKLAKSHIQRILTRPTYYGYFYHNGELCEGNFEPIISKGLFDLVQEKLANRSRPHSNIWERDFAKIFKCGNCDCTITTTIKRKYVKKIDSYQEYVYHHCTRRRGNCNEPTVTDVDFKEMLYDELDKISIDKDTWRLGMEIVKAKNKDQMQQSQSQIKYLHNQQAQIRSQIDRIIEMRANEELTKDEFLEQKERLVQKLAKLDAKTSDNSHSTLTWLELMEEFFNTAFQARDVIENGTPQEKQKMLACIGQNFLLKDGKVELELQKPYDTLLDSDLRTNMLGDQDSNLDK